MNKHEQTATSILVAGHRRNTALLGCIVEMLSANEEGPQLGDHFTYRIGGDCYPYTLTSAQRNRKGKLAWIIVQEDECVSGAVQRNAHGQRKTLYNRKGGWMPRGPSRNFRGRWVHKMWRYYLDPGF